MIQPEHKLQDAIRLKVSSECPGIILRTNSGIAWQGNKVWSPEYGQHILTDLRPYKGLPKGFSDLLYLGPGATTAFIEVKTATGRTSPDQDRFLDLMRRFGHSTVVVRSAEEAVNFINSEKDG